MLKIFKNQIIKKKQLKVLWFYSLFYNKKNLIISNYLIVGNLIIIFQFACISINTCFKFKEKLSKVASLFAGKNSSKSPPDVQNHTRILNSNELYCKTLLLSNLHLPFDYEQDICLSTVSKHSQSNLDV